MIALHSNLLNLLTVELLTAPIEEVSLEACLSKSIETRWELNTPKGVNRANAERFALVIQFFPQFLVFGYAAVLWQASSTIRESAKHLGLLKIQSDS